MSHTWLFITTVYIVLWECNRIGMVLREFDECLGHCMEDDGWNVQEDRMAGLECVAL